MSLVSRGVLASFSIYLLIVVPIGQGSEPAEDVLGPPFEVAKSEFAVVEPNAGRMVLAAAMGFADEPLVGQGGGGDFLTSIGRFESPRTLPRMDSMRAEYVVLVEDATTAALAGGTIASWGRIELLAGVEPFTPPWASGQLVLESFATTLPPADADGPISDTILVTFHRPRPFGQTPIPAGDYVPFLQASAEAVVICRSFFCVGGGAASASAHLQVLSARLLTDPTDDHAVMVRGIVASWTTGPGGIGCFVVDVQNRGLVADTFGFSVDGVHPGARQYVVDKDGRLPDDELSLAPSEVRRILIQVDTPASEGSHDLMLLSRSTTDPAATAQLPLQAVVDKAAPPAAPHHSGYCSEQDLLA